jgi:hypothetical protein
MSAELTPQVVDPQEFIPLTDFNFTGDEVTVEKKRIFITELRRESTVFHAAQHARISRKTAYKWQELDPVFAEAWSDALEESVEVMEHSVYHRALNGDSLLTMFWLKRHRPEYRDKMTIDISAVNEEIQERMRQMEAKGEMVNSRQIPPPPTQLQKGCVSPTPQSPVAADDSTGDDSHNG